MSMQFARPPPRQSVYGHDVRCNDDSRASFAVRIVFRRPSRDGAPWLDITVLALRVTVQRAESQWHGCFCSHILYK